MQKPIASESRKKDYSHTCLAAVDAHVREVLANMIKDNKNEPVKASVIHNIEEYSIGRRAMALLEHNAITPNHRCNLCNGKGYQLERGDKLPPDGSGKVKYKWFSRACYCLTKLVKPTMNLDKLNIPIPVQDAETGTDQGGPTKARAKAKRAPAKPKAEQGPAESGTPGPKKRSRKTS